MNLEKLKECKSKYDLANLLKYSLQSLSCILFKDIDSNYSMFYIDKKDGTKREILAPNEKLKKVQKNLSKILCKSYECINKNPKAVHGFIEKKSIITNAKMHKNKRYVLNIDLKDFFPSITFNRIVGFFKKNKHFQLEHEVAILIAQILCHKGKLPQGSPSSPIMSNLIMLSLDKELNILSKKYGLIYTRYADDITFSTNKREFPKEIAYSINNVDWNVSKILERLINNYHFEINHNKTRMQYRTSRQETTGIVVNKIVNVSRTYIRNIRAMLNKMICNYTMDEYDSFKSSIKGRIDFIYQVRKDYIDLKNKKNYEKDLIVKLFNKYFYFDKFVNNSNVTILTEGKTDKIYIDAAFSHFKNEYNYDIDIVRHSDMFLNITKLNGIKKLKGFIDNYKDKYKQEIVPLLKKSKIENPKYPVVIIIDSDEIEFLKELKLFDDKYNLKNKYIFKEPNLYCFHLPQLDDKEFFSIEYYFQENIRNKYINGKRLRDIIEKENIYKIDDKSLTKSKFSQYIRKLRYDNEKKTDINSNNKKIFSEFKKIFDLIDEILKDYNTRIQK